MRQRGSDRPPRISVTPTRNPRAGGARSGPPGGALTILLLLALLAAATGCGGGGSSSGQAAFGLKAEDVAAADNPSALAFAPDGRLFIAEQFTGNIRIVTADGRLLGDNFAHIDVADWLHEDWGLTGLALDPGFASNHYVYAFYTELQPSDANHPIGQPKLVRFTDQSNVGAAETTISSDFPQTRLDHQGFKTNGSIHFGPDGYLYITMGDYDYVKTIGPNAKAYPQDLASPIGKILRVEPATGKAAPGNPFASESGSDARVFAYGFNRGADFAFSPQTKKMYGTDNTDSCEQLNVIEAGKNYGWPDVGEFPFADCTAGRPVPGIYFLARPDMKPGDFQSPVNVAGIAFASGQHYPTLGDSLLVCEGAHAVPGHDALSLMKRLVLSGAAFDQVSSEDTVVNDCTRAITTSPDGVIYYANDSQVRRLTVPAK